MVARTGLSRAMVQQTLYGQVSIVDCGSTALDAGSAASSVVTLVFAVGADGTVTEATARGAPAAMLECTAAAVKATRFARSNAAGKFEVTITMDGDRSR